MSPNRRAVLPLLAVLLLTSLGAGLTACGYSSDSKDVVEGEPVKIGDLKFNVTFSRYLNPRDSEDSAYLVGQPPAHGDLTWFGVFLEIQNEGDKPEPVPTMSITDAAGTNYPPFPSHSLYALQFSDYVQPQEQIPVLDSTAQQGSIEGGVVLFRLSEAASENRPLTFHIGSEGEDEARVTLDL